jgi:Spy/CpxP family protein refolding chaperone
MKKITLTLLFIAITVSAFSQGKERRERIKSLKIAFITEKLELTQTEAQKFWPIYNAYEINNNALRQQSRENRKDADIESMNDADVRSMIDKMLVLEQEKLELKKQFITDLITVIPAKKVILLKISEDEFNRRMFNEIRKRKGERKE